MKRVFVAFVMLWLFGLQPAGAVGLRFATAPDPDDKPLQVAIWYPSASAPADTTIGIFDMHVAMNGAVAPGPHPLIVMSHGTGGSNLNASETAQAFAEAGFIVAAVLHTGDNYLDTSNSFTRRQFVDRPRHISRVIDFMLGGWSGHASIDAGRIGIFGHSAGGTTALLIAGGLADLNQAIVFCRANPEDWSCAHRARRSPVAEQIDSTPISAADKRVKAIIIAAPAITVTFKPDGLKAVTVPVQVWVGEKDEVVTDASQVRTLLPTPPDYHLIPNGGHFASMDPCNDFLAKNVPEICFDPKGFDRAAFLTSFQQSAIAFYREHLK